MTSKSKLDQAIELIRQLEDEYNYHNEIVMQSEERASEHRKKREQIYRLQQALQ